MAYHRNIESMARKFAYHVNQLIKMHDEGLTGGVTNLSVLSKKLHRYICNKEGFDRRNVFSKEIIETYLRLLSSYRENNFKMEKINWKRKKFRHKEAILKYCFEAFPDYIRRGATIAYFFNKSGVEQTIRMLIYLNKKEKLNGVNGITAIGNLLYKSFGKYPPYNSRSLGHGFAPFIRSLLYLKIVNFDIEKIEVKAFTSKKVFDLYEATKNRELIEEAAEIVYAHRGNAGKELIDSIK